MVKHHWLVMGLCLGLSVSSLVQAWQDEAFSLTKRWETISTRMEPARRADAFSALADEVDTLAQNNARVSEVLVLQGIILASLARETGGLDALGPAKQARRVLERAIELDPRGHEGSAHVTLGALYARAPGWPVAFGDDDEAERLFQRAIDINPDSIAAHYYYATFLEEDGREQQALTHARRAVDGQARQTLAAWDDTLRRRAAELVQQLEG